MPNLSLEGPENTTNIQLMQKKLIYLIYFTHYLLM